MGFFANIIRDSRRPLNTAAANFTSNKNSMDRPFFQQSLSHADAPLQEPVNNSGLIDIKSIDSVINKKDKSEQEIFEQKNHSTINTIKSPSEHQFVKKNSESVELQISSPGQQQKKTSTAQSFSSSQSDDSENNHAEIKHPQSKVKYPTQKYDSVMEDVSHSVYKHSKMNEPLAANQKNKMQQIKNLETPGNYLQQNIIAEQGIKSQEKIANQSADNNNNTSKSSWQQLSNTQNNLAQSSAQEQAHFNQLNNHTTAIPVKKSGTYTKKQQSKTPEVRIGQINVVIESSVKQTVTQQTDTSSDDLSSRLFLRGL